MEKNKEYCPGSDNQKHLLQYNAEQSCVHESVYTCVCGKQIREPEDCPSGG